MIDRAALLTEIFRRNDVRRKAQLPLLDVRAELQHASAVALERSSFERYREDWLRIRAEVRAEILGRTLSGEMSSILAMAIGSIALRRFHEWLETHHDISLSDSSRNATRYGAGAKTD